MLELILTLIIRPSSSVTRRIGFGIPEIARRRRFTTQTVTRFRTNYHPRYQLNPTHAVTNLQLPQQPRLRFANNPTELTVRLKRLLLNPRLDQSTSSRVGSPIENSWRLIRSSSREVATISVWTEYLKTLIELGRYSMIYKVYLDCKRRKLVLDPRFFTTFLRGLSRSNRSDLITLDRLKDFWSQASSSGSRNNSRTSSSRSDDRDDTMSNQGESLRRDLSIELSNSYLNCLVCHGYFDEALEFFKGLNDRSVDNVTLTQMVQPILRSSRERQIRIRSSSTVNVQRDEVEIKSLDITPIREWYQRNNLLSTGLMGKEKPRRGRTGLDFRACLTLVELFMASESKADQEMGIRILSERFGLDLEKDKSIQRYKYWDSKRLENPLPTASSSSSSSSSLDTVKIPLKTNEGRLDGVSEVSTDRLLKIESKTELTSLMRFLLKLKKFSLVKRIFKQIIKNRDLVLGFSRNNRLLDQIHFGLAIVAMGKCGDVDDVLNVLKMMLNSGEADLRPNQDTLDKSIQAIYQSKTVTIYKSKVSTEEQEQDDYDHFSRALIVLARLTERYEILNEVELKDSLIISTGSLIEEVNDKEKKKKKSLRRGDKVKDVGKVEVSNRTLCTLLQICNDDSRVLRLNDLDRVLNVIESFDRKLPTLYHHQSNDALLPTRVQTDRSSSEHYKNKMSRNDTARRQEKRKNDDSEGDLSRRKEFSEYWIKQYVWILTDVLDKTIGRFKNLIDKNKKPKARVDGDSVVSVVGNRDECDGYEERRLKELIEWRELIERFMSGKRAVYSENVGPLRSIQKDPKEIYNDNEVMENEWKVRNDNDESIDHKVRERFRDLRGEIERRVDQRRIRREFNQLNHRQKQQHNQGQKSKEINFSTNNKDTLKSSQPF